MSLISVAGTVLSHDRERHLWLYLQASGLSDALSEARIVPSHVTEMILARRIEALRPACYVQGDLYPTVPGIQRVGFFGHSL